MFRFWYRFVLDNNSIIARGASNLTYRRIEPELSDNMGGVFEGICKEYLWILLLSGKCPIEFTSLGRWWGNEKVDLGVLETLMKRARLFSYKNVHYFLFSKAGFTQGCIEKADEEGNVTLVSYGDIVASMIGE